MSTCVSCRIEARRERFRDIAQRAPRIAMRLNVGSFAALVVTLLAASLWRIEIISFPPVDSVATGWVAVVAFGVFVVTVVARGSLLALERYGRHLGARSVPHLVLTRDDPEGPVTDPASGSAYRSARTRMPAPPPPLCVRHAALARQNQPPA